MRRRMLLALVLGGSFGTLAPQAQRPVQAQTLVPFVTEWRPFDAKIEVDEPAPKGTITQKGCGVDVWAWDRPMPSYPCVARFKDGIRISVRFTTPQLKATTVAWWSDDPRLKTREKDLRRAKSFDDLPKDIVWHPITDIVGGQWSFDYFPPATGQNTVRVMGFIAEATEVTRRPLPIGKFGEYKGILRGAEVVFIAKDPFVPNTKEFERCFLGRDGKLNPKRICRAFYEEGFGGTALLFDYRNEPGPDDPLVGQATPDVPAMNGATPSGDGASNRWAIPVTKGETPVWVVLKWPDGNNSQPCVADGNHRVAIPPGVTKFKVYVGIPRADGEYDWVENVPFDEKGARLPYYPTPDEQKGGEIKFDVQKIARK